MKKCPVVHFELPYKDGKRVSEFYSKVFGWDMMMLGPEMSNYILAGTTETENMVPTKPGAINGGLFQAEEDHKNPLITISVEDINKSMEMVKEAGGKIINGPHEIQGVGLYVAFEDSEGNRTSLLQPNS
ncbi:MAG: VOC family protein [Candidatus Levybacteria bacterium]|nr:VOC family protein [Candidatus Levybacteria bacterium]